MRVACCPWASLFENLCLEMEIGFLNYIFSDCSICAATSYLWYMFSCVLFFERASVGKDGKILPAIGSRFESSVWEWKLNLWTTSCLVFCLWGHVCCLCVCQDSLHWLVEMSLVNNMALFDISVKRLSTVFNPLSPGSYCLSINTKQMSFKF